MDESKNLRQQSYLGTEVKAHRVLALEIFVPRDFHPGVPVIPPEMPRVQPSWVDLGRTWCSMQQWTWWTGGLRCPTGTTAGTATATAVSVARMWHRLLVWAFSKPFATKNIYTFDFTPFFLYIVVGFSFAVCFWTVGLQRSVLTIRTNVCAGKRSKYLYSLYSWRLEKRVCRPFGPEDEMRTLTHKHMHIRWRHKPSNGRTIPLVKSFHQQTKTAGESVVSLLKFLQRRTPEKIETLSRWTAQEGSADGPCQRPGLTLKIQPFHQRPQVTELTHTTKLKLGLLECSRVFQGWVCEKHFLCK